MSFNKHCDQVLGMITHSANMKRVMNEQEIATDLNISLADVKVVIDRFSRMGFVRPANSGQPGSRMVFLQPAALTFVATGASFVKQEMREVAADLKTGLEIKQLQRTNRLSWIAIILSAIAIIWQVIEKIWF